MSIGAVRPVIAIVSAMEAYQVQLMRAARRVLARRRIPLIAHCDGPITRGVDSRLLVSILRETEPLGVLSMNAMEQQGHLELLELLATVDVPAVHLGVDLPDQTCVWGDSAEAMRALLTHVLDERRATRPVLVRGIPHHADTVARERVFRDELSRRGIPIDENLLVTGYFAPEATYREIRRLVGTGCDIDAVVAMNDRSALAAIDALNDAGLRVPEDVAVTGFDNDTTASHWPGLTTVDQGLDEQGAAAASLLLAGIDRDGQVPARRVVVPARLIVRGSTARAGEPAVADLTTAIEMAKAEKDQLAAQDGIVSMSHALDYCWTIDDIVEVLDTHLTRLGVDRGFLALYERSHTEQADSGLTVRVSDHHVRLVLDHRDGRSHVTPSAAYPAHDLLPDRLAGELEHGFFVLQPLAVLDRPFGFILFEQTGGSDRLTELMRIDLSRALDGVLTTQETRTHAAMLERVVARRTQELQAEVMTRRRAERELQRANEELHRSAMLDGLTQIANRAAFGAHLSEQWSAQSGSVSRLALLMVDVDAFKPYNDRYGHVLGDEALRTVASCLARAVWGSDDLACRYGGEEFAVVLPRSGVEGAVAVAQRFQGLLGEAAIEHVASPVAVGVLTASIGIAVAVPQAGVDPQSLVEAADEAMYRAKALGRNRIQLADGTPPAGSEAWSSSARRSRT